MTSFRATITVGCLLRSSVRSELDRMTLSGLQYLEAKAFLDSDFHMVWPPELDAEVEAFIYRLNYHCAQRNWTVPMAKADRRRFRKLCKAKYVAVQFSKCDGGLRAEFSATTKVYHELMDAKAFG